MPAPLPMHSGARRRTVRAAWGRVLLPAAALALIVTAAGADSVVTVDGTIHVGKILKETPGKVVIEVRKYGAKLEMTIRRSEIRTINHGDVAPGPTTVKPDRQPAAKPKPVAPGKPVDPKAAAAGPGYYRIPIKGWLGAEVLAETFSEALADAKATKPDYVVVIIDSFGGSLPEAVTILDALAAARAETKGTTFIAHVRRAQGAAAAIALAVGDIYMHPGGTIEAAWPEKGAPDDFAQPSAEDVSVRIIEAAQAGGHSELIARALTDPSLELCIADEGGKPVVKPGAAGRPLTAAGEALVLDAKLAVATGLARGAARSLKALAVAAGHKAWHEVGGKGRSLMLSKAAAYRQAKVRAADEKRRADLKAKREAYRQKVEPEIAKLDEQITQLKTQGTAVETERNRLAAEYQQEVTRAQEQSRRAIDRLDRDSRTYHTQVARQRGLLRRQMMVLEQRYRPQGARIQAQITALLRQIGDLEKRKRRLMRGAGLTAQPAQQ